MILTDVERWSRVLATYAGRDKALRSLYAWLVLRAQRHSIGEYRDHMMALARQLSSARLIMRQLNHPSMLYSALQLSRAHPMDRMDHGMSCAITGIYSIFGVVELFAWLGDAKLIAVDSAKLFRYCLYLWIAALAIGLVKSCRALAQGVAKDRKQEWMTVASQACDLISGIHSLPFPGFLWSGKLSISQNAAFSLAASVIAFAKLF